MRIVAVVMLALMCAGPVMASGPHHHSNSNVDVDVSTKNNHDTDEVGRPASVYTNSCSAGASVSAPGGGASFGNASTFCHWILLSQVAYSQGNMLKALEYRKNAEAVVERRDNIVIQWLSYIPLIGAWF